MAVWGRRFHYLHLNSKLACAPKCGTRVGRVMSLAIAQSYSAGVCSLSRLGGRNRALSYEVVIVMKCSTCLSHQWVVLIEDEWAKGETCWCQPLCQGLHSGGSLYGSFWLHCESSMGEGKVFLSSMFWYGRTLGWIFFISSLTCQQLLCPHIIKDTNINTFKLSSLVCLITNCAHLGR